jgi:hypothetical protein
MKQARTAGRTVLLFVDTCAQLPNTRRILPQLMRQIEMAGFGSIVVLALIAGLAGAQPTIFIDAKVDPRLREIRGTMWADGMALDGLHDPLARLPEPVDDLSLFRTYPGRPNRGEVLFDVGDDGTTTFVTRLPRRWGALGATRHGLFANGGWYPQPSSLKPLAWEVNLQLPPGVSGSVSDVSGEGTLTWRGVAERAPIAAVRRGQFRAVGGGVLLTRGDPRRSLLRELDRDLGRWPVPLTGVVVEAPLRRRLVRPGPGLAYVSDRAYRLSAGLQFAHRRAVTRGVAEAWTPIADPFVRSIAAAGWAPALDEQLRVDTDRFLRRWAWIPQVNGILASRRMAFYADILDLPFSGDPIADDLREVVAPTWPGPAVAAQLDDTHGLGSSTRLAEGLTNGLALAEALTQAGLPRDALEPYRRSVPQQDYALVVRDNVRLPLKIKWKLSG